MIMLLFSKGRYPMTSMINAKDQWSYLSLPSMSESRILNECERKFISYTNHKKLSVT